MLGFKSFLQSWACFQVFYSWLFVVCNLVYHLSVVSMLFLGFDSSFNSFVDFCPWFQFYGLFSRPTCFFLFFKVILSLLLR